MVITLTKCRTGCPTQDHESWGECARVSNIGISHEPSAVALKTTDKELNAYRDARKLGIQPASTKMKDIQKAVRVSEKIGRAAQA